MILFVSMIKIKMYCDNHGKNGPYELKKSDQYEIIF